MISPILVIWILALVLCLFVGREIGKWMFGVSEKMVQKKKAAQVLATELRANGLKIIPQLLEDFAIGNVNDMLQKIYDLSKLVESGSDAIKKELEETYESVLDAKMQTAEGMALLKSKIAEVEKAAAEMKK
jgi:hypothetical protein